MTNVAYDRWELVVVGRELLETVSTWFPGRPGAQAPENFVWASGFLARCHALLSGLTTMVEHGEDDAALVLYRPLLETYFSGLYALLGGEEAAAALRAGQEHDAHNIEVALGRATKDDRPEGADMLRVSDYKGRTGLVDRVDALLEDVDPDSAGWARKVYTTQYLPSSFHDTHGGLGSLSGYVMDDAGGAAVSLRRGEPGIALRILDMAISLLFSFATVWATQVGKDTTAIGDLYRKWGQLARPEEPVGEGL